MSIPQSITRHIATELPVALFDELNNLEGIKQINRGRRIEIHADYGAVDLLALDIPPENRDDYRFKGSTLPNLWQQIFSGEALLISEPYAFHNNLKAGDHLNLTTPGGIVSLKVGGVFFRLRLRPRCNHSASPDICQILAGQWCIGTWYHFSKGKL